MDFLPDQILGFSPEASIILVAVAAGLLLGLLVGYLIFYELLGHKYRRLAQEAAQARKGEHDQFSTLYNMVSSTAATLKYDRVLDLMLDQAGSAFFSNVGSKSDLMVSAVMLFEVNDLGLTELRVASSRRLIAADQRARLPGKGGVIARVIATGEPELIRDSSQDPELNFLLALKPCRSIFVLPLRTGLDVYGVLLFAHSESNFFDTSKRELLDLLTRQSLIAIQNARLYNDLEKERQHLLKIQDEARKKLARELHDGPTQTVAALAMRINFTRRLIEMDVPKTAKELAKIEELAHRATREIRHMLFALRPLALESSGLPAALITMADNIRQTYDQNVTVQVANGALPELEMSKQTVLFYIAEEAVNNARKHSQASQIWVNLKPVSEDVILMEIRDNGIGFDVESVDAMYDQLGSLGMLNMRERAELINGVFSIDSSVGKGTSIRVLVPVTDDAVERLRRGG
ncbi:MAG: GAF domain-containing sensor histidine kinase [Anaerolineales bacterium]|jgi:signal transduction histidine kinase|nr:GAF domain-containing sensor histidine kinase [Anaerolineales bacterium]